MAIQADAREGSALAQEQIGHLEEEGSLALQQSILCVVGEEGQGSPQPLCSPQVWQSKRGSKDIPIQGSQWNWLRDAETIVLFPWLSKLP